MPTVQIPHMLYWVEVPAGLLGDHKTYYFEQASKRVACDRPQVPWDQLWVLGVHNGRATYHNRVSRQTLSEIPGVARSKIGPWPIHRDRRPHEWDLSMVAPAPEYTSLLYDPDIPPYQVCRPEPPADDADKEVRSNGHVEQKMGHAQPGQIPTARTCWPAGGCSSCLRLLTEGLFQRASAEAPCVRDCARRKHCDGAEACVRLVCKETLPGWMSQDSLVRFARLPRSLQRLEGICGTVDRIGADHVRVNLPSFFGSASYDVDPGWIAPMKPGMWAYLTRMRPDQALRDKECVVIQEFCPLVQEYVVRAHAGEPLVVPGWQLSPFVGVGDLPLTQPVRELTWKSPPEKKITFASRSGHVHTCAVHLPLGWDAWQAQDRKGRKPWPLLVHLHGHGGDGTMFHATRKSVKSAGLRFAAENFVVLSPDCRWTWKQEPHTWVAEIVETFRACEWVDPERIYLSGYSMGGMGTWMIGAQRPDLFAALAPIAGYYKPEYEAFIVSRLASTPIVVAASLADTICPFSREAPLYQRLQAAGCRTLQVFLHDTAGHGMMWEKAFCESEFVYHWLLAHRRQA